MTGGDTPAAAATTPTPAAAVERRIVSVLFADLVGFTALSEELDPEDVATVQDAYFSSTRETIARYGGVVEKFIGDAVMAVFGAPRARDDDAERAVRAGLALVAGVEQLGARLGMEAGALRLRVGVNSGEVAHATSGPDAGRVTGDTVNTAARLQTAADPGSVLVGELTALAIAETIELGPPSAVELKGKAEPVRARTVSGVRSEPSREKALGALRAPMLGRDAELARLDRLLADARPGTSSRIVIVAPPGVGKSRLLAELAHRASVTVVRARVRPQATAPYETVAQLLAAAGDDRLAAALGSAGIAPSRAAVVADEVRRLTAPEGTTAASSGDLAADRQARFEAWLTALDALTAGPAAFLVEDVHWAGGDLLAFLDHAGASPSPHGRVVVATARPSILETAAEWVAAGERLDLEHLAPTDGEALVRALVGDALPDRLVAAVVERSDGTPLFIEELLRTWASVGILTPADGGWQLTVEPDAVPVPPTVQAIYAAQLDDLPADARQVARRGSVAGRRIPVAALDALDVQAASGLDALHRRALVAGPQADPITGEEFAYRHALLRDAGYATLARAERAHLHLAMASWLEAVAGERSAVVAEAIAEHHASALDSLPVIATGSLPTRAELSAAAASWYERAAAAALGLSAHEAAIRQLRRAIELTASDDATSLARRRLALGRVLAGSDDLDAGIAELEAALDLFADDPDGVSHAAYELAKAYMQQIRFDEAESVTERTLDRLADAGEATRARLHALHAWAVSAQGRTDGVREETDVAVAAAEASGDPEIEVDVLEHVAAARDEIGDAGPTIWARLEERAHGIGRWHAVVVAGRIQAMFVAEEDPKAAVDRLVEVAEVAWARGLTEQGGWTDYARCEALWVLGRWDEALELGRAVIARADRFAYRRLAFRTWLIVLPIAAARRDVATAADWDAWWNAFSSSFPPNPSPYARVVRAGFTLWADQAAMRDPEPAPSDLPDALVPMMNAHYLAAVESTVRTWLDAGLRDPAAAAAQRMAEFAAGDDATRLMRCSARLVDAWVSGSEASAREAVALAREHPAPWWELRALQALGDGAAADIGRRLEVAT